MQSSTDTIQSETKPQITPQQDLNNIKNLFNKTLVKVKIIIYDK